VISSPIPVGRGFYRVRGQLCLQGDKDGGKSVHYVYPFYSFQAVGNRLPTDWQQVTILEM
jgi:hypothetical protein